MVKYMTKEEIADEKTNAKEERNKIDQGIIELSAKKKQFDKLIESLDNLEWYYYNKEQYESRFQKTDVNNAVQSTTPRPAIKKVK